MDGGPDDPGWVALPGLPADCPIERALHPERLFSATWTACPEGGCEQLAVPGWSLGSIGDAESGSFALFRDDPRPIAMLVTRDGIAGAWRGPDPIVGPRLCQVGRLGVGDGHAGFVVTYRRSDDTDASLAVIYHAALADIGRVDAPLVTMTAAELTGNFVQGIHVSASAVAGDLQPGAVAFVVDVSARVARRLRTPPAVAGVATSIHLIDDLVLWADWSDRERLAYGTPSTPAAIYFEPTGDFLDLVADREDIAFQVGLDPTGGTPPYGRIELWTAPFTRDPSTFAPRLVGPGPGEAHAIGDGMIAWAHADAVDHGVRLLDLADGRTRTYSAPPSTYVQPLYVSTGELLVLARVDGAERALRIDPRALPYD